VALPSFDELKAYLRVTTDVENDLIAQINDGAQAWIRGYYGVPLDSDSRLFRGLWPKVGVQRLWNTRLIVPIHPCSDTAAITDADGTTVTSTTYYVDPRTGYVEAKRNVTFDNPPYDITVDVGWAEHPDYDVAVDPILRQGVLWAASTYYRNRNVAAIYEQSGGQVSITYTTEEIPPLLRAQLSGLRDNAWFAR
jgi:hypothetical protein